METRDWIKARYPPKNDGKGSWSEHRVVEYDWQASKKSPLGSLVIQYRAGGKNGEEHIGSLGEIVRGEGLERVVFPALELCGYHDCQGDFTDVDLIVTAEEARTLTRWYERAKNCIKNFERVRRGAGEK